MFAASVSEFIVEKVLDLIWNGIRKKIDLSTVEFFQKKRIKRQVEDSVEKVLEPLLPFLNNEGINEDKQKRLFLTCTEELAPLLKNPDFFFQSSLNGQKIFNSLYSNNELPQVIIEDGTKDFFIIIFPQVAELLYQLPLIVKDWENLAWKENYQRLDEIADSLHKIFSRISEIQQNSEKNVDEIMGRIRRSLISKTAFDMDLTGLRGEKPQLGNFYDFFIHPIIQDLNDDPNITTFPKFLKDSEVLSFFSTPNCFFELFGAPGSGKSTWTKWFQFEILNSNVDIFAIRVELRSIQNHELLPIHELVRETAGINYNEELTMDVINCWLANHQLLFIFDGFDEIKECNRDLIINWIKNIFFDAQGCSTLITSRPLTTNHLHEFTKFTPSKWKIMPFDNRRIEEYIKRWYMNAPNIKEEDRSVDSSDLINRWVSDPTIEPLTGNPLLLSTLLMVHYLDGKLPNGRAQLYKRYINGMLGIWDDRRKLDTDNIKLSGRQKKSILQMIALNMILQKNDQIDETVLLQWLSDYLLENNVQYDAMGILSVLHERTGLLIGPGIYSFAHKSISEYLVAEVIIDGDKLDNNQNKLDRMYLFNHRNDDYWNSTIFFWAGLSPTQDLITFINLCLDVYDLPIAYGILYDQYDKLSGKKVKREMLLRYIPKREIKRLIIDSNHGYIYELPGLPSNIQFNYDILTFDLNGIQSNAVYGDLLTLAISDKIICFEDRLSVKTEYLKFYLWLRLPEMIDDISEVENYFNPLPPFCNDEESWQIYLVYKTLLNKINPNLDLSIMKNIINKMFSTVPSIAGITPFLLLCNIIKTFRWGNDDYLHMLFRIFFEVCKKPINEKWLLLTLDWNITNFVMNTDLLLFSKHFFEMLEKYHLFDDEKMLANTINCLIELTLKRSHLILQTKSSFTSTLTKDATDKIDNYIFSKMTNAPFSTHYEENVINLY